MNLFDLLNHFNYNIVRKKLFRREVESAYFTGKDIKLPPYPEVTPESLSGLRKEYPFRYYNSEPEKRKISEMLGEVENPDLVLQLAGNVIGSIFTLPGGADFAAGESLNWNKDYNSNYQFPAGLSWKHEYINDSPHGVDIKNCWYIARFYQGMALGHAYLLTGDEKYTEAYIKLFNQFITSNRFCTGVNWLKTSEVSIRLLNVLFGFGYFIDSDIIDVKVYRTLIDFVIHHSVFIENNIEFTGRRGSSYLVNLLALGAAGMFLKRTYYGKKHLQSAYSGMEQEIRQQVHEDGVSYEQSVPLHTILTEVFLLARVLFGREGYTFTPLYEDKLKKMFYAQAAYLRKDGTVPQVGDAIIERILPFNILKKRPDHISIMASGACMYNEPEFKISSELTPELILLFGQPGADSFQKLPAESAEKTASFLNGGHFIMRSPELHMFIEAGEIGKRGLGAPGHNDTFSFELVYKNEKFIVDPGTYSIYADKQLRNSFRSIKNHNTAYIDDEELSELEGLFKIKDDITKPKVVEWHTNNEEDLLVAQHYGYAKLTDPVIIKRTFNYLKAENRILITDEFLGGGSHRINLNMIMHPAIKLSKRGESEYYAAGMHSNIIIKFSGGGNFKSTVIDASYSEGYGRIEDTKKIVIAFTEKLPAEFTTEIILR